MKTRKGASSTNKKRAAPDDFFQHGPISVARFGNLTVGQSNWKPDEFKEYHKRLAEAYPKIVSEINALIVEATVLISTTKPLSLLHLYQGDGPDDSGVDQECPPQRDARQRGGWRYRLCAGRWQVC